MLCCVCNTNEAVENKRACAGCIIIAKNEEIEALQKAIEAHTKRFNNEGNNEFNVWKKYNDAKHDMQMRILILKGEHPEEEKKSKIRDRKFR
jgi:hypothetical protein